MSENENVKQKQKNKTAKAPTPKTPKQPKRPRLEREDPNGPFAPKATAKNIDATKCIAAQLGAVGNERQCGRARVDGEWCKWHGPTHRAECKAANSAG